MPRKANHWPVHTQSNVNGLYFATAIEVLRRKGKEVGSQSQALRMIIEDYVECFAEELVRVEEAIEILKFNDEEAFFKRKMSKAGLSEAVLAEERREVEEEDTMEEELMKEARQAAKRLGVKLEE